MAVPDHERREAWESVAAGWEKQSARVSQIGAPVARRMVELLDPQPGETILDVAAGLGDVGFAAAPHTRPGGRLITTDFAAPMVEAARRRAAQLGVADVELLVADAHELPLADGSVDGALCRWGYMLMPDPAGALRETRRVLREGAGRLVFAVWTGVDRNPWATTVGRTLVRLGHDEAPDPAAPGMFALGEREPLEQLVRAAGFASLELEEVELTVEDETFDAYWASVLDMSANTRSVLAPLSDEQVHEVRDAIERDLERFRTAAGYRIPGVNLVGVARVA